MEVITIDESYSESDCEVEGLSDYSNSVSGNNSRLVPNSSCGQADSDCNEISKEFGERNDENQERLKIMVKV